MFRDVDLFDIIMVPVVREMIQRRATPKNAKDLFRRIEEIFPDYAESLEEYFNGYYGAYMEAQKQYRLSLEKANLLKMTIEEF